MKSFPVGASGRAWWSVLAVAVAASPGLGGGSAHGQSTAVTREPPPGFPEVTTSTTAPNVLKKPALGRTCGREGGDCTSNLGFGGKKFDFAWSVTSDVRGSNIMRIAVLADSSRDADAADQWSAASQFTISGANSNVTKSNVPLRLVTTSADDSWKPGGLARVSTWRFDTRGSFFQNIPAQFEDAGGTLRRYPEFFTISGNPIGSGVTVKGDPGKAVLLLSDDRVTPADVEKEGLFLTYKGKFAFPPPGDPVKDTNDYYDNTCVTMAGTTTVPVTACTSVKDSIRSELGTLDKFKARYGMAARDTDSPASNEYVAKYYNEGDLGIGRNMHCKIKSSTDETACYVKNYASDNGDLIFGVDYKVAFANLDARKEFATVAMVARGGVRVDFPDKVIFLVYKPDGTLLSSANLDRHALKKAGVEGTNYNSHIPGNCMVCHGAGGDYEPQSKPAGTRGAYRAKFLPFDLDNFKYHPTSSSLSRSSLQGAFKNLNTKIVLKVANQYAQNRSVEAAPIINSINGWYKNNSSTFLSSYVPIGWTQFDPNDQFGDKHMWQKMVRPICRTCHQSFSQDDHLSFEKFDDFQIFNGGTIADVVCPSTPGATPLMPQAEQASRVLWQSDARGFLAGYLYEIPDAAGVRIDIKDCIPGKNR